MQLSVLGTGYVGLVTGAGLAALGHTVTCIDIDAGRIEKLCTGAMPLFEPELAGLVATGISTNNLRFRVEAADAIADSDAVFIAVGTPSGPDGRADLRALRAAAQTIGRSATRDLLVLIKSTVPVGTGDEIFALLCKSNPVVRFDVVANPEFLREGSAVSDFMEPDRIVFGRDDESVDGLLKSLYPGISDRAPVVMTQRRSAELIKHAANSFLAMKVTFINEMADICEQVGADVSAISAGIGLDPRIGPAFLRAGPGFGGSCFPKDMLALIRTARDAGRPSRLVETTVDVNNLRIAGMAARIIEAIGGNTAGKRICLLGITFKPETDDVRASAAVIIAQHLIAADAEVHIFDPQGRTNAEPLLVGANFFETAYAAAENADVIVIATEWAEFSNLDLARLAAQSAVPVLVDLRNVFSRADAELAGFRYFPLGRP